MTVNKSLNICQSYIFFTTDLCNQNQCTDVVTITNNKTKCKQIGFTVFRHTTGGISPCKATNCVDIQFCRGCFGFAIMLMHVSEIHQCPEEVKATIKMETSC